MPQAVGYAAKHSFSSLKPITFDRRDPGPRDVAIDILFCGICHSDIHQVKNEWHNTLYPCLPGHEIVGRVAATGAKVTKFKQGDLVGVGCMVDSCGICAGCREGLENYCEGPTGFLSAYNGPFKPGSDPENTYGGYSNSIVVKESFVLAIPEGMHPAATASLLCAGVTTYSPLMHWKVGPGQKVGIVGFGGLGHVATQIAKALGAEVTVFTTSEEKTADALRLGAAKVVLSTDKKAMTAEDHGYDFLLSTIPESYDLNPYVTLLKRDGTLVSVGALEPYKSATDNSQVAFSRRNVAGSLIGSIAETQEVLDFCAKHNIVAQIELIPIDDVNDAYPKVEKGQVRYRYVIDMATLKADA